MSEDKEVVFAGCNVGSVVILHDKLGIDGAHVGGADEDSQFFGSGFAQVSPSSVGRRKLGMYGVSIARLGSFLVLGKKKSAACSALRLS